METHQTDQNPTGAGGDGPSGAGGLHGRERSGIAGQLARRFIDSPLTPLLLLAFFVVGAIGMMVTPREEDPQISVPMVDIFVSYPGATASEVSNLVSEPLERLMSEISGVKHVYSMSNEGMALVTVRFKVGEQMEPSLVKLNDALQSNMDIIPKGVLPPLVKPKSIDDVPVVTITLSSDKLDLVQLRKVGLDALQRFKSLPNTGQSFVTGGSAEKIRVEIDPASLSRVNLSLSQISGAIAAANQRAPAGNIVDTNLWFNVYSGSFLRNAQEVGSLVIASQGGRPLYLRDIATITQGESETTTVVSNSIRNDDTGTFQTAPAVTIAVSKKKGANGVSVAHDVLAELEVLKGSLIPENVRIVVSRDYGETAQEKVSELIFKLFVVSGLVTVLVLITMGIRPAIVVLITIPAVLLMSLAVAYVLGFSINRVSMFALVFAIGILVDDAIVVVENIYRRWLETEKTDQEITVDAVDEVGNPTILATLTVVAALLPMGFVSGLMGPYMLPIPVLSSAAMVFSLFAAFIFVPWLSSKVKPEMGALQRAAEREHRQTQIIAKWYGRLIDPIMGSKTLGNITLLIIIVAMLASVGMFFVKWVPFKMLPYDNKSEVQVVIDMPAGTDLFVTANLSQRLGIALEDVPEVAAYQTYVGTSSPFNFNGLVRHYYLRSMPWQADIAVQLSEKSHRKRSSHEIATEIRAVLTPIARAESARLTIAEAPPGPPVLAPVVAEIYGPTAESRQRSASIIRTALSRVPDAADINTFIEDPHDNFQFKIDREKAEMFGASVAAINREIAMATGGFEVGPLQSPHSFEQASIVLQVPLPTRVNVANLSVLPVPTRWGTLVPLGELGQFIRIPADQPIFRKDLKPVDYVLSDAVGRLGAPLYVMLDAEAELKKIGEVDGPPLKTRYFSAPDDTSVDSLAWDGEWHVTYVTFRDMGIAFMAALLLIYILVVAEFKNFMLPLVIMAPIPLTLIGIVPGHFLLGADFTATSMIGFIALAGIIVRNSILLVEFALERVAEGMPCREAIVLAGRVRLRPILITALALVIGSMVLLSDPIFQGMAVSLLFGSLIATFLTLIVMPLGCASASASMIKASCHCAGAGRGEIGPANEGDSRGGPDGDPPPAPPPQRPAKLVKKSQTGEQTDPRSSGGAVQSASSGRPPKLQKESVDPSGEAATEPQAAPTRPPRLKKKSEMLAPSDADVRDDAAPENPGGADPALTKPLPAKAAKPAAPKRKPAPKKKTTKKKTAKKSNSDNRSGD